MPYLFFSMIILVYQSQLEGLIVGIRPLSVNAPDTEFHGRNYNAHIGSRSKKSAHIFGRGVDWHAAGYSTPKKCKSIRSDLLPMLEPWGVRMEDIDGGWVHNDDYPVGNRRFFRP